MTTIDYSLSKRGKNRRRLQKLIAGLTLSGLAFSGISASLFLNTTPAYAAPLDHAYGYNNPAYDYILGSWRTIDGSVAYCIQLQVPAPNDSQVHSGESNTVVIGDGTTVSGVRVAQLNYVLNKWGDTSNDLQAAAVAWTLWYLTGQVDENGEFDVLNEPGLRSSIFTFAGNDAQLNMTALESMFQMMSAEAVANAEAGPPQAPADVTMTGNVVDGELVGTATVPEGYTNLNLTNATFDSNSSATINPDRQAGTYEWTASNIPDSATSTYTVSVNGQWSTPATGEIVDYWSSTDGQDVIAPPPFNVGGSAASIELGVGFSPILETAVPVKRVTGDGSGEITVADTVTFSTNPTALAPFNSDLRQFENGTFAQITATGTLYGPLEAEPVQGTAIPTDAPVAGTTSITTSPTDGFSRSYDASVAIDDAAGFYTWVWEIDSASQSAITQPLIPENYNFQDDYGIPNETAYAPTKLTYDTELTVNRGEPGTVAQDNLTTSVDGYWLEDADGNKAPANLTGTVYYHGDSAPAQQATVPATASAVQTLTMEVTADRSDYVSEDITFPQRAGFYTIQWCTDDNELFADYCDNYGVPSETFEVNVPNPPTVNTQAQLTAMFGDNVTDTAFVQGDVPANSALRFTAYREAIVGDPKFNADGQPTEEIWTAEELDSLTELELCMVQPIGTTGLTPVDGPGEYTSEPIRTTPAGSNHRMYWVEDLININEETEEETLLDQGICGEETEITYVEWPTITTDAGGDIRIGDSRGDRTSVKYANQDLTYTVTHELYYNTALQTEATCDASTLVFDTNSKPVSLTGSQEYEFVSEAYKFDKGGKYFWIEKLWHGDQEVAAGYCGNPSESLQAVIEPEPDNGERDTPLNATASPMSSGFLIAGLALLVAGAGTAVFARRA